MDVVKTFKKEMQSIFIPIEGKALRQLHKIQLEMLNDFVSFCNSNNLTYYLTGGSALGAIRHNGFIPWDDDIDIVMPRKDYSVFRSSFPNAFSQKYSIEAPMTEHTGSVQFMKIRKKGTVLRGLMSRGPEYGVFIDVFPLEYAPNVKLIRLFYQCWYFILKSIPYSIIFSELYDSVFKPYEKDCSPRLVRGMHAKRLWGKLLSIIPASSWLNYFDRAVQKKPSKYYVVPSGIHTYTKECFPVEYFYPPRKAVFEGLEVSIPNKVEKIMTAFYGNDFMTPPKNANMRIIAFTQVNLGNEY